MIAIVEYNAGNIRSVANALSRLGYEWVVTGDPESIRRAEKVIFPGVGEASSAMRYLREKGLDRVIAGLQQPVLGICLGLQLMCRKTEEGNTHGLGIFDADVHAFPPLNKVPHMGWNSTTGRRGLLFDNVDDETDFYFVHSFAAGICTYTTAITEYIVPFSSAMEKGNFFATQFHPEKSGTAGEAVLLNFLRL